LFTFCPSGFSEGPGFALLSYAGNFRRTAQKYITTGFPYKKIILPGELYINFIAVPSK